MLAQKEEADGLGVFAARVSNELLKVPQGSLVKSGSGRSHRISKMCLSLFQSAHFTDLM